MRIDEARKDKVTIGVLRFFTCVFFKNNFVSAGFNNFTIFDGHGLLNGIRRVNCINGGVMNNKISLLFWCGTSEE